MDKNNNGFADMADYFGNLSRVDPVQVTLKSLEKAASFYMQQLIPNIPRSLLAKKHMADQVKVIIENNQVKVAFEGTAFYWRFEENGTVNKRAKHFASGTYEKNKNKIEELMVQQVLQLWEG